MCPITCTSLTVLYCSLPVFMLLVFLVMPFHAFAYGELCLLSKSTWTVWLLHNSANGFWWIRDDIP